MVDQRVQGKLFLSDMSNLLITKFIHESDIIPATQSWFNLFYYNILSGHENLRRR